MNVADYISDTSGKDYYIVSREDLVSIADVIRDTAGVENSFTFPTQYESVVETFSPGGGEKFNELVSKTISGPIQYSSQNIGAHSFRNCTQITSFSAPIATTIGIHSFDGCTKLTTVDLPEVTEWGIGANDGGTFAGCSKLTSVTMPKVTSITYKAFDGCTSLTDYSTFGDNVTQLWNWAFSGTKIQSAVFKNVTYLGDRAFNGCTSLTIASFPLVTTLRGTTFYGCTTLQYAIFSSVTAMGAQEFQNCSNCTLVLANKDAVCTCSNVNSLSSLQAVYVPNSLLSDYKAATNFSSVESKIYAIEDSQTILDLLDTYGYDY